MTRKNTSIINRLVNQAPSGVLLTNQWLKEHGITNKLAWWYVHSGWLEKSANKLYKRGGAKAAWYDVVLALQQQLKLPVHIGGKTALQLLGKSHYVPVGGIQQIDLYTRTKITLPSWLHKVLEAEVRFNAFTHLLFEKDFNKGIIGWQFHEFELQLSSPERAILELISTVPQKHTYEEAYLLMENLSQLRAHVVQSLLEKCRSIKAKRLFLSLAEKCQHEWLKDLHAHKINLGSGKRKIGAGGVFDAKYQISAPKITAE